MKGVSPLRTCLPSDVISSLEMPQNMASCVCEVPWEY